MIDLNELESLCKVWQQRMSLSDWDVRIEVVRKDRMPENRSGQCSFVLAKKAAVIYLLHPEDADSSWVCEYDIEQTLVHELVHLHLAPWSRYFDEEDSEAELFLEQTVHALSTSLYKGWGTAHGRRTHVEVHAIDAASILQHSSLIADAVRRELQNGHPLNHELATV